MSNTDLVLRFEEEFKNRANVDAVDELFAPDARLHLGIPGLPESREALKMVGQMIFGQIRDLKVNVDLTVAEGDLVADRISARGMRMADNTAVSWTENHIYRCSGGRIVELWSEISAPPLQP